MEEETKTYDDLVFVEAKLLEQEHRPTHLILNYLNRKRKWEDPDDPRRKATQKAIIWRLFFSPAVIAVVGSSLVAWATIFFLNKQNTIIEKQNELLTEQNVKIEIQANLEEAGRRNNLVLLMDNILQQVGDELKGSKDSTLSKPLLARIQALAQGFQPYKFLDYDLTDKEENDSLGLTKEYSPERGQLLLALVKSPVSKGTMDEIYSSVNFSYSYLKNSNLSFAYLKGANLSDSFLGDANLDDANLYRAILVNANLKNAYLVGTDLSEADLVYTDLSRTHLVGANLKGTYLQNADLSGATLINTDLSDAYLNGANLKRVSFLYTDLMNASIKDVKSIDSAKVDRPDWLIYIRDSLQVKGAKVLVEEYYVKNVNSWENEYLVLKKE